LPESRRKKEAKLLAARGEWHPWADAEPVAARVRELQEDGATLATIAAATGVSIPGLWEITSGERDRVRTETAEKIMAAQGVASGRRTTEANGTALRLRSLQAMGHSSADLAAHMSAHAGRQVHQETVRRLLAGEASRVQPHVWESARAAFEELWDKRPPEDTPQQKRNASMARERARKEGWPQPMALDDDRIDDRGYRLPWQRQQWLPAEGTGIADRPKAEELEAG